MSNFFLASIGGGGGAIGVCDLSLGPGLDAIEMFRENLCDA